MSDDKDKMDNKMETEDGTVTCGDCGATYGPGFSTYCDCAKPDNIVPFPSEREPDEDLLEINSTRGLERVYAAIPALKKEEMGVMDAIIIFAAGCLDSGKGVLNEDIESLVVNWWQTPVENLDDAFVEFLFKRGLAVLHCQKEDLPPVGAGVTIPIDLRPYIILGNIAFQELQQRRNDKDEDLLTLSDAYDVWVEDIMGRDRG